MNMKNFLLYAAVFATLGQLQARAQSKVDFTKDIQPIFEQTCIKCHGREKQKGKLRLDSKEATLKGGKDGVAIVPGDAAKGELYKRITLPKGHDDIMPNEGEPLTKAQTDLIKDWINQGANWPDNLVLGKAGGTEAAKKRPEPVLPTDFKPSESETKAIAKLAQSGVDVRPIAMNVPWREANLRLLGSNVTDTTLVLIKDVTSLVELNLATTKITDGGLQNLKGLAHLQRLHLELTSVTDAGLANLKGLTNLVYLNLYGTAVTDAGLANLKGLPFLHNLYVWQTKVTEAGVADLKKSLPNVDVSTGAELMALLKKEEKKEEKAPEKKEDKAAEKKEDKAAEKKEEKAAEKKEEKAAEKKDAKPAEKKDEKPAEKKEEKKEEKK